MLRSKILIIEDDGELREVLSDLLEPAYKVLLAEDGMAGLKAALRTPPDLILLDLKMPKMDGFQICQLLRADKEFTDIPILVLSGYGGPDDRSRALEAGADDFLSKPADGGELLARIERSLAKRKATLGGARPGTLRCGDLRLELNSCEAHIADKEIHFSQIEFRLLWLLALHFEKVVSRQEIIENIWADQKISSRLVDPHILSIRNKLSESSLTIVSEYGKGYRLKAAPSQS